MSLLALIRHGATDWNAERRLQGRADRPRSDSPRATRALRSEPLENNAILLRLRPPLILPLARLRHHPLPERNRHAILLQVRLLPSQIADAHIKSFQARCSLGSRRSGAGGGEGVCVEEMGFLEEALEGEIILKIVFFVVVFGFFAFGCGGGGFGFLRDGVLGR